MRLLVRGETYHRLDMTPPGPHHPRMPANRDPFVMRAKDRVQKLTADIAQLEAQEEGVRRRRLELVQQVSDWERAMALYAEAMDIESAEPAPGQLSATLDAP